MTTTAFDVLYGEGKHAAQELEGALDAAGATATVLLGVTPGKVAEAVIDWLRSPLSEGLQDAWHKVDPIIDAVKKTAEAGSSESVTLFDHKREIEQRGHLNAARAGASIPLLDLILSIDIKLESLTAHVARGRVTRVTPGEATATVKLEFSWANDEDVHLIREVADRTITLPGSISIPEFITAAVAPTIDVKPEVAGATE